jgi:hypothetical protein
MTTVPRRQGYIYQNVYVCGQLVSTDCFATPIFLKTNSMIQKMLRHQSEELSDPVLQCCSKLGSSDSGDGLWF